MKKKGKKFLLNRHYILHALSFNIESQQPDTGYEDAASLAHRFPVSQWCSSYHAP